MGYRIGVVSLLPEIIAPVEQHGVVGRACERGLLEIAHTSPREFATDRHRTVDDRPYGGGPGMVLKYEPLRDAIRAARAALPENCPAFVLSARGRPLDQSLASDLAAGPGLLLVAGRYEGVDERIVQSEVEEELSVGDYVLSGGELAAAVVIDAVARLLPEVLGHEDSSDEESFMTGLLEYPQYTRPEAVDGLLVTFADELVEQLLLFGAQLALIQQIRSSPPGASQRLLEAPAPDFRVVTLKEDVRHT